MGPPSKPIPGLCWHVASHAVFVHSFRLTMWEDRSTAAGQCNFLFFSRQSSRLKTLLSFEDCCKAGQRWWHVFSNVWTMLFHVLFMALLLEIRKDCHKVFYLQGKKIISGEYNQLEKKSISLRCFIRSLHNLISDSNIIQKFVEDTSFWLSLAARKKASESNGSWNVFQCDLSSTLGQGPSGGPSLKQQLENRILFIKWESPELLLILNSRPWIVVCWLLEEVFCCRWWLGGGNFRPLSGWAVAGLNPGVATAEVSDSPAGK